MKRKILISLGVFVILVVAWFFVTLVLADFDFKLVFGVDERTPDSLSYYEEIKEIQIGVASDNVILKKTESSFVNIDYYKSKLYEYEFSVEDGILKIKQKRIRFTIFQISKSRNLEIAPPGTWKSKHRRLFRRSLPDRNFRKRPGGAHLERRHRAERSFTGNRGNPCLLGIGFVKWRGCPHIGYRNLERRCHSQKRDRGHGEDQGVFRRFRF